MCVRFRLACQKNKSAVFDNGESAPHLSVTKATSRMGRFRPVCEKMLPQIG